MLSARNRELAGLLPVALLVTAGFAAVIAAQGNQINDATATYGIVFLGLCLVGHLFIRVRLPYADPYLYPLAALLAAIGIVTIYRIDPELAREQAQWFVLGLVFFFATVLLLRDLEWLRQYRFTIAAGSIVLLLLPRLTGGVTNGAYLQVDLGPLEFQPAELAKLGIVIFMAAYLAENRRMLITHERRVLGVAIPPLRYFGPMLTVWVLSMAMLVFIRDLGSSVMFYGGFLVLLYVATERLSYVVLGLGMFVLGFLFFASTVGHVGDRVDIWLHPFDLALYEAPGGSYQIAQSVFAQADGGMFGVGLGESIIRFNGVPVLPAAQTDLVYSVIVNELGLAGGAGLLIAYLLFAFRGFKTAVVASDVFVKLLATGLTAVFAFQVFVIVGGVTRVIPLTGVTLPWVSYGGSSIAANFILLALLMIVSNEARRPQRPASGGVV
jgi:cell division protein FtsW (lipid II flippase)